MKLLQRITPRALASLALAGAAMLAFGGCAATEVGNYDGTGLDSGLTNLPQARHQAWETDARFGNLPQSR